jgi:5'-deoxynucleotidase YfbR-like HD superfamily hydrolase
MNVRNVRRANATKRFHTVYRHQEETVGHHSANVAALVLWLYPSASVQLLTSALVHDWPEYATGDVPAPAKWANPPFAEELKKAENTVWRQLEFNKPQLSDNEQVVLKLADMLDLVLSSVEEVRRGNREAMELVKNGVAYINDLEIPDNIRSRVNELVKEVSHG